MAGPDLSELLASLLREEGGSTPQTLADRFCAQCMTHVDVTGVALSLSGREGHHFVLASRGPRAGWLRDRELALGEGPGVQSSHSGGPVLVADLRSPQSWGRWPAYVAAVAETPVGAQFSYPLQIGVIHLGVLSLYRDAAGPLSRQDGACAMVLADVATVLLLHLQDTAARVDELHVEIGTAFVATAELHQATGMASVQANIGVGEALLLLHARAFSSGRTSLEVAKDVLAGRINFRGDGA